MSLIESPERNLGDLAMSQPLIRESGRYSCAVEDVEFKFLFGKKDFSSVLFVLLSGAAKDSVNCYPNFQRWSWSEHFPGSVLNIADPTLTLAPGKIDIGWYLGSPEKDYADLVASLVKRVASDLGVPNKKIFFYGSSGGGFASLRVSRRIPGSSACAINAQIDLTKYRSLAFRKYISAVHGTTLENLKPELMARLSVIGEMNERTENGFLMTQNINDDHHYKVQFQCFKKFCTEKNIPYHLLEYAGEKRHGAEPKSMVDLIVKRLLKVAGVNLKLEKLTGLWRKVRNRV